MRCMTLRWLDKARERVAEWAETPAVARIYRARAQRLETDLLALAHGCGGKDPEPAEWSELYAHAPVDTAE